MAQAAWMGGQERERIKCLPDDLRAFDINADHWRPAAQDEGEWRRTAEQGAECFIAKWIAAEKAKQRMVSLFVLVRSPLVISHNSRTYVLRGVLGLQMPWVFLWRNVCFVLFCFVFVFLLALTPRPFVHSLFDIRAPRQPHAVS